MLASVVPPLRPSFVRMRNKQQQVLASCLARCGHNPQWICRGLSVGIGVSQRGPTANSAVDPLPPTGLPSQTQDCSTVLFHFYRYLFLFGAFVTLN